MSYPDDPNRVRFNKGESAPVELPYPGYTEPQYLDPYTGQPTYGGTQQPQYGEQPYGVSPYPAQGYQQYGAQPYPAQPYGQGYPAAPNTNGMAIGALVASIAGTAVCGIGSIVGIILGYIALNQIKRTGEQGRGMAVAGIIIGYVIVALVVLYIVVVVIIATSSSR